MNIISKVMIGLMTAMVVTGAVIDRKSSDDKKLINRINRIRNSRKQKKVGA